MAKRRLCLGPTGVINCTPLSMLSFWVSLFPGTRGYDILAWRILCNLAGYSSWSHKEWGMTERLNWTEMYWLRSVVHAILLNLKIKLRTVFYSMISFNNCVFLCECAWYAHKSCMKRYMLMCVLSCFCPIWLWPRGHFHFQISLVKQFSVFLYLGRYKSLGSLKSFLSYASQLSAIWDQYPAFFHTAHGREWL